MPLPIVRDDYDSDPEIQAEKELAIKDPEYANNAISMISQKKAATEGEKDKISTTPPNVLAGSITKRTKSCDEIKKLPKTGNQTKALKKQRSRGISGCSSRKHSGYDYDGYDLDDYNGYDDHDVFDEYDEDDEDDLGITKTA